VYTGSATGWQPTFRGVYDAVGSVRPPGAATVRIPRTTDRRHHRPDPYRRSMMPSDPFPAPPSPPASAARAVPDRPDPVARPHYRAVRAPNARSDRQSLAGSGSAGQTVVGTGGYRCLWRPRRRGGL